MFFSLPKYLAIAAIASAPVAVIICDVAHASDVQGRITVGGYAAQEKYSDDAAGSADNDFMTASARFYLRVSQMGEQKNMQFVADLRDKDDFFGSLNAAQFKLAPLNTFQAKELDITYDLAGKKTSVQAGRFPVQSAGDITCDGASISQKLIHNFTVAGFAGLDPKRNGDQYVTFHSDSEDYGAYIKYQSPAAAWNQNLYSSLALVQQTVGSEIDRRYIYSNTVYQWSSRSHLIEFLYLDTVPKAYVQLGYFNYLQELQNSYFLDVSALGIDVIEYVREQDVRSQLDPSPYQEGTVELRRETSANTQIFGDVSYGKRQYDLLERTEFKLGINLPRYFSPKWDFSARAGARHNFTSNDTFAQLGFGYFSNRGEASFSVDDAIEKYNDGVTLHPLTLGANFGIYFEKALFGALSLEYAKDENVKILSTFLKVSYRWGSREIPPIRDGAAPRGRL